MAFKLVKDPMDTQVEFLPISSQTVSVGEVLELDAGATTWTTADASTLHWQRKAVAIAAATSSDTEVKAILVHPFQLWEANTGSTSSANHNGDRMALAAGGLTVNNSGSDATGQTANFVQFGLVNVNGATDTVVGYFLGGTGVDPDAA